MSTRALSRPQGTTWLVIALVGLLATLGLGLTMEQVARNGGVIWAAALGDEVALPGGALRVEQVIPEHLAPMNHGRYANLGMTMSSMVPDSTPEGQRTFTVLVTLIGRGADGLELSADQFTVSGAGVAPTSPLRSDLGYSRVPAGSGMTGVLVFRVPAEAQRLTLRYAGGHPVILQLGEAPGHH